MQGAVEMLERFDVPHEVRVVSAHRTPREMLAFGQEAAGRGLRVLIAGAGGAAHLPGMLASVTRLPVVGVPVALSQLDGLDSLLSIVQMPKGVPVATMAVNGARNAGLLAVRILALGDADLAGRMEDFQEEIASDGAGPGRRRVRRSTARWLRGIWRSGSATRPTPSWSSSTPTISVRATRPTWACSNASPRGPSPAPRSWCPARGPARRPAVIGARTWACTSPSTRSTSSTAGGPSPMPRRSSAATEASRARSGTSGTTPTLTRFAASAGPRSSGPSCGASTSATSIPTWARCSCDQSSSTSTSTWPWSSACRCGW